jgi:hypothetical protein
VPSFAARCFAANILSKLRLNHTFAERGCLVHDCVRLVLEHGLADCIRVEQVEHHRPRAERLQKVCARRRIVSTDHLVACIDQLRNESAADRPARSCDENSHHVPPFGHIRVLSRVYWV